MIVNINFLYTLFPISYRQIRLLKGLGIKSVLLTDGKTPVNLYGSQGGGYNP